MSDIAIRVENLGKKYKIGANQARYQTLRESIVNGFSNSIERIKGTPPKEDNIIWALKDINFEVKHGEVLGIIGRNGAGKSTLLKILSRITKPTTGRFELNGRVGSLLEVGTGFHPELTGRDNIYLSGAILGMKRKEINRKFDEIVDFAEVEKFLDTPVKHYSSGMYMRMAFSVAAHLEPEILLVDEVLAVGDAEFQKKCLGKMGDVAGQGRTVIYVSHNMGSLESLCQNSILLHNGVIKSFDKTKNIINLYLSTTIKNEKSIAIRIDRQGTGKIFFDDIRIDDQMIKNRILNVDLFIQNREKKKINNILLSIVICDSLGKKISNLVNYIIKKPLSIGVNGERIRLSIINLNLVPGTYSISPFISSDIQNSEIYDWVIDAIKFDVPDYDYYRNGTIPYIKGDTIYLDYIYEIISNS